jgi:hypothetical protein
MFTQLHVVPRIVKMSVESRTIDDIVIRLRAGRPGVRFVAEARAFSFLCNAHTGPGANPIPIAIDAGRSFPGGEVDPSFPTRADVEIEWSCTSTPNSRHELYRITSLYTVPFLISSA